MESQDLQRMIRVLEEIRDNQQQQLATQREQFALYQKQAERAERLQDRAERLQIRGSRATAFVLPIMIALIAYVSWLIYTLSTR